MYSSTCSYSWLRLLSPTVFKYKASLNGALGDKELIQVEMSATRANVFSIQNVLYMRNTCFITHNELAHSNRLSRIYAIYDTAWITITHYRTVRYCARWNSNYNIQTRNRDHNNAVLWKPIHSNKTDIVYHTDFASMHACTHSSPSDWKYME